MSVLGMVPGAGSRAVREESRAAVLTGHAVCAGGRPKANKETQKEVSACDVSNEQD